MTAPGRVGAGSPRPARIGQQHVVALATVDHARADGGDSVVARTARQRHARLRRRRGLDAELQLAVAGAEIDRTARGGLAPNGHKVPTKPSW
jgi:hypothetical protein